MPEIRECSRCGSQLPPDAPEGICPKCVWGLGFDQPWPPHEESPPGGRGGGVTASDADGPSSSQPPTSDGSHTGRFVLPDPRELAHRYPHLEILELLGQGGMGAVYKARHRRLDRLVALKILPAEVGADPAFEERFTREARALARLNHPHIVTLYDFGEVNGQYYLLMELVDGVNLRRMIAGGKLEPREALAIVPQICEALQFAHDEGIVHRDIKPENILLDKKGRVKIADFGLAKLVQRGDSAMGRALFTLTGSQQVMGTPHYMAPEQMERPQGVDHRADIYSLGVVFYEMLTGELPLGRFAAPSHRAQIDVRLDEIVLRSLEKEPDRRYQHASAVKLDVERVSSTGHEPLATGEFAGSDSEFGYVSSVQTRLVMPGVALVVVGIIGVFLALLAVLVAIPLSAEIHPANALSVWLLLIACTLPFSLTIIMGGLAMRKSQPYGLARVASVLAILPIHTAWLLGVPAGIWALVALARPDEKPVVQGRTAPLWSRALGCAAIVILIVGAFVAVMIGAYQTRSSHIMPLPSLPWNVNPPMATIETPAPFTRQRNWKTGPSGPELTDLFAHDMLRLRPHQVVQVNKILQSAYAESLALEARNTERQTDDAGHTVFTYLGPLAKLEDRLWTQLDGVLSPIQQSLARSNLHLDPEVANSQAGWTWSNADMVRSSFFGWGKGGARVEVWRVGKWYHWIVEANVVSGSGAPVYGAPAGLPANYVPQLQVSDVGSAPQPPEEYRRFWDSPKNQPAPKN